VRYPNPLRLAGLALLIAFAVAGAASAKPTSHPAHPDGVASPAALRAAVDHYRIVTWTFQRAADVRRTPTSYSYRRSTDPAYLQWNVSRWMVRAAQARTTALARIRRRLDVNLPRAPRLHASLYRRVTYNKRLAVRLRRIYPGNVTRRWAAAEAETGAATLRLWQQRSAQEALLVALHAAVRPIVPSFLTRAFTCIHHYEGAWNANTGNGYYGGLQMDIGFQSHYGGSYLRRWGTADNWPAWAQIDAAARAYRSGRGFGPWPNTARACGLL
jgi:hypothetical protein